MAGAEPHQISCTYHLLEKRGANWGNTRGWRTASSFSSPEDETRAAIEAAGICDLSHYSKIELHDRHSEPVRISCVSRSGSHVAYRFARDQLLLCSPDEIGMEPDDTATDLTSGLALFLLTGARVIDVLNRLCSLDLREPRFPDLTCTRAPFAQINARIARRDRRQVRAYEIFVGREYGEYVWEAIEHTGNSFGLRPFGLDALRLLEASHA